MQAWASEISRIDATPQEAWEGIKDYCRNKNYDGPPKDVFTLVKHVQSFCRQRQQAAVKLPEPPMTDEEREEALSNIRMIREQLGRIGTKIES